MTIAQNVRNHLRNKPYLLEALEKGIVNLSELSRQIQEELKTDNTSAVKAALRRFSEELQRHKQKREEKVLQVLKRSGIAVYDRKSVMITSKEISTKSGMKVDLLNKFVYLVDNVNIIEFISCWTETIIVVEKKDNLKAYEVLSNVVG
jgi:hypothetical protein